MNSSSKSPPPKPWERKGSTSEPIAVSNSVANGANLSKTPIPDPSTSAPTTISPRTPPSRMNNPTLTPSYDRLSPSYSSRLPYYGGGSTYSSLSGVGGRYGGYGLGYGYGSSLPSRYGSSYGTYGGYGSRYGSPYSSFGGYGSYGSYGSPYNRFGPNDLPPREGNMFQNALDQGYGKLRGFGDIVEGFSRFSQLLDANFDAIHGSFASIIRLIDVFGEFAYMTRSFWLIRVFLGIISKFWRTFAWLLGRDLSRNSSPPNEFIGDFVKHESEQRRKRILPMFLICLGLALFSAPMLLLKFLKMMKNSETLGQLENIWREPLLHSSPEFKMVRALHDFQGSNEMDLSFRKNDMIKLLGTPYPDWWEGEIDGRRGFFPAQFVHLEGEAPRVTEYQDPDNLPS